MKASPVPTPSSAMSFPEKLNFVFPAFPEAPLSLTNICTISALLSVLPRPFICTIIVSRISASELAVMVTAVIDSRNRGPKVSGMAEGKAKKAARDAHGIETKPPPEVVLLPPDALMSDLKAAVNKCFSDLYVVLAKFRVKTVVGFESVKDHSRLSPKKLLLLRRRRRRRIHIVRASDDRGVKV